MTVDLTDVSRAGRAASTIPARRRAARAAQVAFKCLTSPLDLPINDGQFRALEIVLPPGRVVSAVQAGRDAHVDDLSDDGRRHDLQGAGAGHARPASSPATTPISSSPTGQRPPRHGRQLLYLSRRPDRRRLGRQARQRRHERHDRASTTATRITARPSRSRRNFRCWSSAMRCARIRAAPGSYRGGLGTEQVVQARARDPLQRADRPRQLPAVGPVRRAVRRSATRSRSIASARPTSSASRTARRSTRSCKPATPISCAPAAAAVSARRSTASRELVAEDVRQGYVSRDAAERLYGVVLDAAGAPDLPATEARRA